MILLKAKLQVSFFFHRRKHKKIQIMQIMILKNVEVCERKPGALKGVETPIKSLLHILHLN